MSIYQKLLDIQTELKAPKGQFNSFGNYKYRSCEDILEALKPLCNKHKVVLTVSDQLENIGDRYYIRATARLTDIETLDTTNNTAYAREEESKKGMDGSQITGTASSYARKYALNGLFCIDDTKDADTDEYKKRENKAIEKEEREMKKLAEKPIDDKQIDILKKTIEKYGVEDDELFGILMKYDYSTINEIKVKDYVKIGNELSKR